MMPGGHLATAIALGGVSYAAGGSVELAAGAFAGGFLIDLDHYLDYLLFEKQWRHPGPARFLQYYFTFQCRRVVLPLHSMELMVALLVVASYWPNLFLIGYLFGATMHLVLDILVNGEYALKRAVAFYFFSFRLSRRFSARSLMDYPPAPTLQPSEQHPYRTFFKCPVMHAGSRRETASESAPVHHENGD